MSFKPAPVDVSLKGTLKVFVSTSKIIADVLEHLKSIPEVQNLKTSLQFLEYVSSLVENMCSKKASENDKLEMIIKIYQCLFEDVDILVLKSNLQYIRQNKLVYKIPRLTSFFSRLKKLM